MLETWPHARTNAARSARSVPPGFTLVELLVVIAIIAVLVSITLSGLSGARVSARRLACLSNHRQLVTAWSIYSNDYGVFPYGVDDSYRNHERFGWGGVDWYPDNAAVPGLGIAAERPLNPYVSADSVLEARCNVFRCPSDIGGHLYNTGTRTWEQEASGSVSGETQTCYGIAGTSYECNVWMYCKPGSAEGWGIGANALAYYRSKQGPQNVDIAPSRFVVLKDIGPANWIVTPAYARWQTNLWGEWWHGDEREAMGFLDGSARVVKSGLLVSPEYSLHLVTIPSPNSTWRWPYAQ